MMMLRKGIVFFVLVSIFSGCVGVLGQRAHVMTQKLIRDANRAVQGIEYRPLAAKSDDEPISHYPVILELSESEAQDVLAELDAVVFYNRGNLYLTSIPVDRIDRLPRTGGIDSYEPSVSATSCLDVARAVSGVDELHARMGTLVTAMSDEPRAVVTGICDRGFDPRHEAFTRSLKRWVAYDEYHGRRDVYDGYDNIVRNAPATDVAEMTHATHVGGILAGFTPGTPYYGVAPASDFVATTSSLSEVAILAGIEDVIDFAKATGRPAVVNISAGSYLGPHDGTDLVGRYLSALADDAVICFSAGNYGERANCQILELDKYNDPIGSAWSDDKWTAFSVLGGTDLWSRDSKPFEFRLAIWDVDDLEFKYVSDWMGGTETPEGEFFFDLGDTPWFSDGGVWVAWGTQSVNKRFNFAVEYDYATEPISFRGPWARYTVGYHVRKVVPETRVDVYADGIRSFLHGMGMRYGVRGNPDGSISNLASCPDVVAVGAWNSRAVVPDVELGTADWGHKTDIIAPWSAYGTSGDGRKLPHFSAPGNVLVSALSEPNYLTTIGKDYAERIVFSNNGQKYYAEAGTSMASPFAAGVFALWLEEAPTLDVHALHDIAVATVRRDFEDIDDPRWGAGALDAMAGLDMIAAVNDISTDNTSTPTLSIVDGVVSVTWPGVEKFETEVYDLTGRRINANKLNGSSLYVVRVTDSRSRATHVFKIR